MSYYDIDFEDCMRVKIISSYKQTSKHRDYFNIRFVDIDREDDGIFLYPGSYWTFGDWYVLT